MTSETDKWQAIAEIANEMRLHKLAGLDSAIMGWARRLNFLAYSTDESFEVNYGKFQKGGAWDVHKNPTNNGEE